MNVDTELQAADPMIKAMDVPPRQRRVRSVLSPRCAGAAARRAVLSPPHYLSGWCVSPAHISPHWDLGFFPKIPLEVLLCFPIIWENWSQLILLT